MKTWNTIICSSEGRGISDDNGTEISISYQKVPLFHAVSLLVLLNDVICLDITELHEIYTFVEYLLCQHDADEKKPPEMNKWY